MCKWQCQKWLLRVWNNCIPGCAREGILYSLMHTYTEIRADTGVGRHSTRHTQGLFLRPKPETSGGGSPRFAFGSLTGFNYNATSGFYWHEKTRGIKKKVPIVVPKVAFLVTFGTTIGTYRYDFPIIRQV